MITVGMYYDVIEGKEKDFERKFDEVVGVLEAQLGHVQSLLFRQVRSPRSFAVLSEWDSRGAFQDFIRSDLFRRVTDWGAEQILESRPRHRVYEMNGEPT
jgi:heme-degrading monooxygenase HmoA